MDDYCQQEFGKGITVAVEYANTNEVPDINSVPYLMFYNAGKVEGLAKQAEYSCDLVVGVSSEAAGEDNYVVTDSEVYILRSYKLASDIIQIIQQELNNYKDKKASAEGISSRIHWRSGPGGAVMDGFNTFGMGV